MSYRYGLHSRPPGPGAIPKGFDIDTWKRGEFDEARGHRWGTIDYARELTPEEVAQYELKPFVPCNWCGYTTAPFDGFTYEDEQYCEKCYLDVMGAASKDPVEFVGRTVIDGEGDEVAVGYDAERIVLQISGGDEDMAYTTRVSMSRKEATDLAAWLHCSMLKAGGF